MGYLINPSLTDTVDRFQFFIFEQCSNEHPFPSLSPESSENYVSYIFISYIY